MLLLGVIVLAFCMLNGTLAEQKITKIVVVGAGASGISSAAKLLENGYSNIVILEAQDRIGGRVNSVPFGNGFIDLGAQWCQGEIGNVVYETLHKDYQFGDTGFTFEKSLYYNSHGNLVDQSKCYKLMELSDKILSDHEGMAKFNKSFGEFFEEHYRMELQKKEFEDIDKELADEILDLNRRGVNSLYASANWFDISAQLNSEGEAEGNQLMTWNNDGYKILFDFLTKKRPDPSKALPVDEKIYFNKEVTNIDWNSNEAIVRCSDGSEYRADHVIVTVSLGFLKVHHRTLFTPQLPEKKVNAIENTGFGTLGKIFLEFEEPFWPTDSKNWTAYFVLWNQDDKDDIRGTDKEWVADIGVFLRVDAQPTLISALVAGEHMKQFEEKSDNQLIDDTMWLLQKFLGRTLPRPINMRRSQWMTNKYFLGTYSYVSMNSQKHNVNPIKDLAETIYRDNNKPIVVFAGEATDEYSGYVHGAVGSGWRSANEIINYYKSLNC